MQQTSIRELLFWTTAIAVAFSATQWAPNGIGVALVLIVLLLGLARLETLLPQPYGMLIGVCVVLVLVWMTFPSLEQMLGG